MNEFDNNDGNDLIGKKPVFLNNNSEPGPYALITLLVKLEQLNDFIDLIYDSGLNIAVAPSSNIDKDEDSLMVGNSPGSNHDRN